jgi:hypothetical protein
MFDVYSIRFYCLSQANNFFKDCQRGGSRDKFTPQLLHQAWNRNNFTIEIVTVEM